MKQIDSIPYTKRHLKPAFPAVHEMPFVFVWIYHVIAMYDLRYFVKTFVKWCSLLEADPSSEIHIPVPLMISAFDPMLLYLIETLHATA